MTGHQLQAARLWARVVAPVVDWTAGAGAGGGGERTGHGWTPGRELGVLTRCLTVGGVQHDAGDGGGSAARRGETLPTPAKVSVTPTAVLGS